MQSIKTKDVIAYATLPRIVPRAKTLFFSGFGYVAFLMAQIYVMVRLLPADHPYLSAKNIGRFGIRHVVIEASNNLQFKKQNIDQIFIFFSLLAAIIILFVQIALLCYALIAPHASAMPSFDVAVPRDDIGFQILDNIFGVPGMFCSSMIPANCTATNAGLPKPFHVALQGLFKFYSTALLMIGALIFLYFVVVVVLETATTGSPFGQRFQNVWVPIRLVVAIGLLLPVNYGLNSAQYITLYTAKYGASWATNNWIGFNRAITLHPWFALANDPLKSRMTGEKFTMLAIPQQKDLTSLVASMSLIHACAFSYLRTQSTPDAAAQGAGGIAPHYIYNDYTDNGRAYRVKPYLVKNPASWMSVAAPNFPLVPFGPNHRSVRWLIPDATTVTIEDALKFYYGGDIIIRFGDYDINGFGPVYSDDTGNVKPLCGDIRIPVTTLKDITDINNSGGAVYMLRAYYKMVLDMWFNDPKMVKFARSYVTYNSDGEKYKLDMCGPGAAPVSGCGTGPGFPNCLLPACSTWPMNAEFKTERVKFYRTVVDKAIREAWSIYVAKNNGANMPQKIIDCGWACAGAWFNKIAEINGMFMDGVRSIPELDKYPLVMEQVRAATSKVNKNVDPGNQFDPSVPAMSGKDAPNFSIEDGSNGLEIARLLNAVYKFWAGDTLDQTHDDSKPTGNPFFDVMNFFFGTSGIVNMRGANRHMHPLAQLVATGKGLVDSAITNIGLSTVGAFGGGLLKGMGMKGAGDSADAISKMILSMAFLGLMAGFTLFYVLPFLPFVYFFFSVGTWVKTIFEAMVGTPLWALAHLRIDGEGLPGDAASNGYFLLLEIFIRPMLSVFGLVAAITIFAAQVHVLNIIWDLVINNVSGFAKAPDIFGTTPTAMSSEYQRPVMDQFFFMIIFTIIVYMLALASFKLIDQIPNNILRWAGAGVSAFGDMNSEQADALGGYVSRGGMNIGQDAADAMRSGGLGLGGGLGQAINGMNKAS